MHDSNKQATPVDPHKRLFSYCADKNQPGRRKAQITGRTGQFLRSLLLFDHLTIHSLAFREFPGFVQDLGFDATIEILKSGAVSVFPDYAHFGTGLSLVGEARKHNRFSISRINSVHRGILLPMLFSELRGYLTISANDFECLVQAITASLAQEPVSYGARAEELSRADLRANTPSLKATVAALLRQRYHFAIKPDFFELKLHDEGQEYSAETNLGSLCRLSGEEVEHVLEMAIPALAGLNLRIEEMQMHSSLTGFDEEDIGIFESRLRYLIERDNPIRQESQFERMVTLLDLPEIPLSTERFKVDRFLKLRASSECMEFREWLTHTSEWSDADIIEHVNAFRETFARYYKSGIGKVLRMMVSLGVGFVPYAAVPLGMGQAILENFLLDDMLKPSGAIAFIASEYPSLFSVNLSVDRRK